MSNEETPIEETQDSADAEFNDAFDEFAGEGEPNDSQEPERDEQGRFAASEDSDDVEDELQPDLPETLESGSAEDVDPSNVAQASETDSELERYKAEAQQWQHRYNSDLGRQNALQRKIKELEDQLSQVSTPAPESMSQKEWDELQQDFPEIAKAVEAKLGTMTQSYEAKINQLQSQLNPIQELNEQTYISSQMGQLSAEFPDWQETAQSAEFQQWVNQQPVTVRELVQSNEAADAAYLIRTYKATTQPAPQVDATAGIKQKRARQLQQATTIRGRTSGRSSAPPSDDFEAAFDYFAQR